MLRSVADTHAVIWYLYDDPRLSEPARPVIENAAVDGDQIGICAITLAEIIYPLHWPVSGRPYLPERWANDPARRTPAHVPEDVTFQTKPQLALALIDRVRSWEVPFRYVVTDAGYGNNPTFLDGLEERALPYVCAVERTFGVRLPEEVRAAAAAVPEKPKGKGRPKLPRPAPLYTVGALIAAQPESAWQTVTWREGTKGPLRKQFLAIRVHRATGDPAWGGGRDHRGG